ncbi:MAG TPA: lysophospholipid acyltransferase family protein [Thermomicrobiales bacterium]|nr:lysophospholipid acyltransferase family protein [Thermomicrobiales bacterium]
MSFERRWKHALFVATRFFFVPLLGIVLRLRIRGLKNVPKRGGAIVICNHLGWIDPVLLMAASPRPILFMAKEEAMNIPVARWFARQAGTFPVKRSSPDRKALRHAQSRLESGLLVGMFPEGTRSTTGGLKNPFDGASLVAARTGAPIIPCAVLGTEALPGSASRDSSQGGYPRVTVVFGEAFTLATETEDGGRRSLDELTEAMMIEIARLVPDRYRGIYAAKAASSHPAVRRDDVRFTGLAGK